MSEPTDDTPLTDAQSMRLPIKTADGNLELLEVVPAELARGLEKAVGGGFYSGIEWLACWLLDNVEGETIMEEQLRPWAAKAWEAHLKRQNEKGQP